MINTKETNYQTVSKQFKLLAHEEKSQVVEKVKHTHYSECWENGSGKAKAPQSSSL